MTLFSDHSANAIPTKEFEMPSRDKSDHNRTLEVALILVSIGLTALLFNVNGYKLVVLNLFYLPVVLAAFFLGRYRAGVLALFCVVSASVVTVVDIEHFAAYTSPTVIGLSVTIWGAVMGLNALTVGTLSDERTEKMHELHDAYLGVVEVLARYLNSADPNLKDRTVRVAELSQSVASQMKLSPKEIDDIRVAALLQDLENIEVTATVIGKAIGDLGNRAHHGDHHTFHGSDLVHSLGSVLHGALPLLLTDFNADDFNLDGEIRSGANETPFGVRIIRTVRAYDKLRNEKADASVNQILEELKADIQIDHHPAVLHALEQVVHQSTPPASETDAVKLQSELLNV